jgi:hypothetical protein
VSVFASPLGIRLYFQILAAVAMVIVLVIVWRRTRDVAAVAFVGLHPVVPASIINGAHNDALVGLAILVAILLIAARQHVGAGLSFAAAALVKIVGAFPLVAASLWVWRRDGARPAIRVGAAGALVTFLGYVLVGPSAAAAALRDSARFLTPHSLARIAFPGAEQASDEAAAIVTACGVVALVLGLVVVAVVARREGVAATSAMPLLFYVLLAAYVLPWYVAWIVPVLALDHGSLAARAASAVGGLLMVAYWPARVLGADGTGSLARPIVLWVVPALTAALVVVLVIDAVKQKAPAVDREPSYTTE